MNWTLHFYFFSEVITRSHSSRRIRSLPLDVLRPGGERHQRVVGHAHDLPLEPQILRADGLVEPDAGFIPCLSDVSPRTHSTHVLLKKKPRTLEHAPLEPLAAECARLAGERGEQRRADAAAARGLAHEQVLEVDAGRGAPR